MSEEEKSYVPSLTLEPNAQAVAAVAEEEKKDEEKVEDIPVERLELSKLSPAEQAAVTEFSKKIDILNTEQVLNYGSNAQKNISEFSDSAHRLMTARMQTGEFDGEIQSKQEAAARQANADELRAQRRAHQGSRRSGRYAQ